MKASFLRKGLSTRKVSPLEKLLSICKPRFMDFYAFDDYWLTEFFWHKWYSSTLFEVIFFVFQCFYLFVIRFAFFFGKKVLTFLCLLCQFASLVFETHVV